MRFCWDGGLGWRFKNEFFGVGLGYSDGPSISFLSFLSLALGKAGYMRLGGMGLGALGWFLGEDGVWDLGKWEIGRMGRMGFKPGKLMGHVSS